VARRRAEGLDLVAIIKNAVLASGLSLNELAHRSGVSSAQLSRFMTGKRTLTLESASKLFSCLGLKVVPDQPEPPPPARGRRPKGS
jgi:transcriptional regulator with XRE-family HTH domain